MGMMDKMGHVLWVHQLRQGIPTVGDTKAEGSNTFVSLPLNVANSLVPGLSTVEKVTQRAEPLARAVVETQHRPLGAGARRAPPAEPQGLTADPRGPRGYKRPPRAGSCVCVRAQLLSHV